MEVFYSFACSVIGKNHLECGTVLQDASSFYEDDCCSVIVVSDGHGSENFPRSDRGSKYACAAAVEAVQEFLDGLDPDQLQTSAARDATVIQLCKNILLRWNTAVAEDASWNPFTEAEVAAVKEKYRLAYLAGEQTVHAYGATLLLAVLTRDFFLAVRNGDGECVIMDEQGHFNTPIPENSKNEASFVTSLCDEDAIEDFRYFYTETLPVAVMLGSDGVENSYVHLEELFSLYRNICRKAAHEGGPATEEEVKRALSLITARGSGDDVSIACCLNLVQIQAMTPALDQAAAQRRKHLAAEKTARQHQALDRPTETKRSQIQDTGTKRDTFHTWPQYPESASTGQSDSIIDTLQEESQMPEQKPPTTVPTSAEVPEPSYTSAKETAPEQAACTPVGGSLTAQASPASTDGFMPADFLELRREDVSSTTPVEKETVEVGMSASFQDETNPNHQIE